MYIKIIKNISGVPDDIVQSYEGEIDVVPNVTIRSKDLLSVAAHGVSRLSQYCDVITHAR